MCGNCMQNKRFEHFLHSFLGREGNPTDFSTFCLTVEFWQFAARRMVLMFDSFDDLAIAIEFGLLLPKHISPFWS